MFALSLILTLVAAPAVAPAVVPADSARAGTPPAATDSVWIMYYRWVVRTTLLHPAEFPALVSRARDMGVRGLLVQVVGRGDAYYRSDLLPRAEALPPADGASGVPRAGDGDDRFAELIALAHAAGLEVHAWMNCMLVWSAPAPPRDPRHVFNAHPEWMARLRDGRRLSQLSQRQRTRLRVEGAYLAPANPAVRRFVASVAVEIARRYPVDGVQLDYIRQPGVAVGYDPETRARFALATGVDPLRFDAVPPGRRAAIDSTWAEFQREQVTGVVREVRDSLEVVRSERDAVAATAAWRIPLVLPPPPPNPSVAAWPRLELSAAVLADTAAARNLHAQAWTDWVRRGLIDRAFVMCYAAPVQTVLDQLLGYTRSLAQGKRVVPGIAVYNTRPPLAAAKILGARSLGFPLLALYSYDALNEHPGYWPALRTSLAAAGGDRP
jgi:uncharacterized lipoprotein YddW (UPF0748 family)